MVIHWMQIKTDSLCTWISNNGSAVSSGIHEIYIPCAGEEGAEGTVIMGLQCILCHWKGRIHHVLPLTGFICTPFPPVSFPFVFIGWSISSVLKCRCNSEPWPHTVCLQYQGSKTGCCDLPCAAPPYRENILPRLSSSVLLGPLSALHSEPCNVQSSSGKNIQNVFSEVSPAAEGEFSKVGSCHGPLRSHMEPRQTQGKARGQNQVTPNSGTRNDLLCQKSLLWISGELARVSDKTVISDFSKFAYCFNRNMKTIIFIAAVKHHKQQNCEGRAFAVEKCAMCQGDWDFSQSQRTRNKRCHVSLKLKRSDNSTQWKVAKCVLKCSIS